MGQKKAGKEENEKKSNSKNVWRSYGLEVRTVTGALNVAAATEFCVEGFLPLSPNGATELTLCARGLSDAVTVVLDPQKRGALSRQDIADIRGRLVQVASNGVVSGVPLP
jgi:hypothetical protein